MTTRGRLWGRSPFTTVGQSIRILLPWRSFQDRHRLQADHQNRVPISNLR